MHEIKASAGRIVVLGRRKENQARCITFDITEWQATYGVGTVQLLAQRNQDTEPYPCTVEVRGGVVRWEIKETDVAMPGEGRVELQYHVGDTVAKSAIYRTWTEKDLGEVGPVPPAPERDWVESVLQAARDAEQSAQDVRNAVAQTITMGENGHWCINGEDTGVSATGPKGERGDSGLPAMVSLSGATQSLALANNTDYRCADAVTSLTVTGFKTGADGRSELWNIRFVAGDSITVTLPASVQWAVAKPVFVPGVSYWLSFVPMAGNTVLGVWVSNEQTDT